MKIAMMVIFYLMMDVMSVVFNVFNFVLFANMVFVKNVTQQDGLMNLNKKFVYLFVEML